MVQEERNSKRFGGHKMCKKEVLINGVRAIVNVPDSLLEGTEEQE